MKAGGPLRLDRGDCLRDSRDGRGLAPQVAPPQGDDDRAARACELDLGLVEAALWSDDQRKAVLRHGLAQPSGRLVSPGNEGRRLEKVEEASPPDACADLGNATAACGL